MDATRYQLDAARTLIAQPPDLSADELMAVWNAIGLAGEAGEVCEQIKKGIFHQHGLNIPKLSKELGDVLWYLAGLCTILHLNLSEIMEENIDKLKTRYPNGFSPKDSLSRVDTHTPNH